MRHVGRRGMRLFMNAVAGYLRRHYRAAVFTVYLTVVVITMAFHEPWFDEAQSWLIARDCSYRYLLLVRPHYEGHPPLWWLLLSIPAKLGVPYEWGLKGVELVCSALMCGLLVFLAPLPRLAIALLPFTYFPCYQYGVTSRPYALMCCALFAIAACWKSRDGHPWRLTAALVLLCCASSYGITLACAFALVWVVRAVRGATGRPAVLGGLFGGSARFTAWMVLLAAGLALTACILPRSDTFGAVQDSDGNSAVVQFVLFWTVLPSESIFTAFAGDVSLHGLRMSVLAIALCVALSLMVWTVLVRIALRRGNLDLLLIPYVLLGLCATKYFSMHHIGIIFGLFVAQLWINAADMALEPADIPVLSHFGQPRMSVSPESDMQDGSVAACLSDSGESDTQIMFDGAQVSDSGESDTRGAANEDHVADWSRVVSGFRAAGIARVVMVMALLPSLIWNISAIACDIRYDYSAGRALATFVRSNGLEHERWVSFWRYFPDTTWPDGAHTNRVEDTHRYSWPAIAANPYFERNLLDCTYEGRTFVPNQVPSAAQMNREIAGCSAKGKPEFLIGDTAFPQYFFHRLGLKKGDYRRIVIASQHVPWKTWVTSSDVVVYVRSDVYRTLPRA